MKQTDHRKKSLAATTVPCSSNEIKAIVEGKGFIQDKNISG